MKELMNGLRRSATAVLFALAGVCGGVASADSITQLELEADQVLSMAVSSTAPEISTVTTTSNLLSGSWRNAAISTSPAGPFASGALPGMNSMIYVQATQPIAFYTVGQILADIYYSSTANWSSQTVADTDAVVVNNHAVVTLDQEDTARALQVGEQATTGSLLVNQPVDLSLTESLVVSNGSLSVSDGSVCTPSLSVAAGSEVSLDGGLLCADAVENCGTVTVGGGTLSNWTAGVEQALLLTDRFSGENQTTFATSDLQIAEQIGKSWKRYNPVDEISQYRLYDGKLDIGAQSPSIQKATLMNTAAKTVSKAGEIGFRLSSVMQQDHTAGSGFMGVIFNAQADGSYYLFRVSGSGTVQFLVYSQFVKQGGTVLNISSAFSPVQNRLYELNVESVGLHTFNLRIVDTVSGATVYSTDNLAVGGAFLKLDDGVGGIYATADSAGFDSFELIESPNEPRVALMDSFLGETQGSWATTDAQIARQIGPFWTRCNPVDEVSQYRINDGKLDIGAQSSSAQRASLVNTAVETSADGFKLSVVQQQDTMSGSAFMGLIFNFQPDGSYYLLRVSAAGAVQFLAYSQYAQQSGTILNDSSAFTPVQNRAYKLCVESSEPYTFSIRVIDTVTGTTVYSNDDVTVGGSFVQLQDGLGGVFVTHGLSLFDHFSLDAVPAEPDFTLAGSGSVNVESGTVNLNGDTVSHVDLNAALFDVSGGDVSLGQVSVGSDAPAEFRVTGDAGAIDLVSLSQGLGAAESGTFRFVFDADGISPVSVASWMDLGAAALAVDGSAYAGGPDRFTLFDSEELISPIPEANVTVSGFSGPYEASVEQDLQKVELVYKEPDLFEDVTAATGLDGMGNINWACWFDFNHDEWLDLAAGQHVWVNNGGTNFTDLRWVGNVIAADFDNDGWVDLFSHSNRRMFRNNQGTLEDFTLPAFPDPYSCQAACWGDFNGDGWVDLYVSGFETPYFPNLLLINNGGVSFTMSTLGTGDASRGVTTCDFDQDHDLDIYVSNYRLLPNDLWVNNGSASFSEQASAYNVLSTERGWSGGHSIGNCWGDFDNDGLFDLFSGNFSHRGAGWGGDGIQPESDFYRNRGPANGYTFEDKGTCGIYWQESYASPAAGDYNNDGRLDLFLPTAYVTATSGEANFPVLFRNESDFSFAEVDDDSIAGLPPTTQAAWGDYNNDGQLDLMTAGKLFKNKGLSTNSWLKVRLAGDGVNVNSSAIGAQVRITLGAETLSRQVDGATGQGSQNDPSLHFGLGAQTAPVDLTIIWPDGTVQTTNSVAVNQMIVVTFDGP